MFHKFIDRVVLLIYILKAKHFNASCDIINTHLRILNTLAVPISHV